MKCGICKKNIEKTFLNKIIGTYVKDKNGKKHNVCPVCQKQLSSKKDILKKL